MVVLEILCIFVVLFLQGRFQLLSNDTQETSCWRSVPLLGALSAGSAAEMLSLFKPEPGIIGRSLVLNWLVYLMCIKSA